MESNLKQCESTNHHLSPQIIEYTKKKTTFADKHGILLLPNTDSIQESVANDKWTIFQEQDIHFEMR